MDILPSFYLNKLKKKYTVDFLRNINKFKYNKHVGHMILIMSLKKGKKL